MTLPSVQTAVARTIEGVGEVLTTALLWLLISTFAVALIAGIGLFLAVIGNEALHLGLSDVAYVGAAAIIFAGLLLYDRFA